MLRGSGKERKKFTENVHTVARSVAQDGMIYAKQNGGNEAQQKLAGLTSGVLYFLARGLNVPDQIAYRGVKTVAESIPTAARAAYHTAINSVNEPDPYSRAASMIGTACNSGFTGVDPLTKTRLRNAVQNLVRYATYNDATLKGGNMWLAMGLPLLFNVGMMATGQYLAQRNLNKKMAEQQAWDNNIFTQAMAQPTPPVISGGSISRINYFGDADHYFVSDQGEYLPLNTAASTPETTTTTTTTTPDVTIPTTNPWLMGANILLQTAPVWLPALGQIGHTLVKGLRKSDIISKDTQHALEDVGRNTAALGVAAANVGLAVKAEQMKDEALQKIEQDKQALAEKMKTDWEHQLKAQQYINEAEEHKNRWGESYQAIQALRRAADETQKRINPYELQLATEAINTKTAHALAQAQINPVLYTPEPRVKKPKQAPMTREEIEQHKRAFEQMLATGVQAPMQQSVQNVNLSGVRIVPVQQDLRYNYQRPTPIPVQNRRYLPNPPTTLQQQVEPEPKKRRISGKGDLYDPATLSVNQMDTLKSIGQKMGEAAKIGHDQNIAILQKGLEFGGSVLEALITGGLSVGALIPGLSAESISKIDRAAIAFVKGDKTEEYFTRLFNQEVKRSELELRRQENENRAKMLEHTLAVDAQRMSLSDQRLQQQQARLDQNAQRFGTGSSSRPNPPPNTIVLPSGSLLNNANIPIAGLNMAQAPPLATGAQPVGSSNSAPVLVQPIDQGAEAARRSNREMLAEQATTHKALARAYAHVMANAPADQQIQASANQQRKGRSLSRREVERLNREAHGYIRGNSFHY